jgi:hypothetical protein
MPSLYHIIDRIPCIEAEGMFVEYEELANKIAQSGLVRVDTGDKCNFARWVDPGKNVSIMISKEQLEQDLIESTKSKLFSIYQSEEKILQIIEKCRVQLKKFIPVEPDLILKISRLLVQSAHPIVIRWLLKEQVEIFVSYSYNIGDMMDVMTWKHSGTNSGMQSTDGFKVAIYTSSGGNPFAVTDSKIRIYGDGWPAIARMQIIVAQELGHYADIKRDFSGRQIGRHSADFACTRAAPYVKQGRIDDIGICNKLLATMRANGLTEIVTNETALRFYRKNNLKNLKMLYHKILIWFYTRRLMKLSSQEDFAFLRKFQKEKYMGLMIDAMIDDMKFNLSPIADVYKRDDKEAEIAIACVEALARVPQQCVKWGHITTSIMMKNLYNVYYKEVIPDLVQIYEKLTGAPYKPNLNKIPTSFRTKLKRFFSVIFRKENLPYRDLE